MTARLSLRRTKSVQPTIAAGVARGLLDYARSRGADDALLARAGLNAAALDDPDARVPLDRYLALIEAAKAACQDPAFALHFGAAVPMTEMSIVGLIGLASETVADGFRQLARLNRLIVDVDAAGPRFRLVEEDGARWIVDDGALPSELVLAAFARMAASGRRIVAGRSLVLAADFVQSAPAYAAEVERVMAAPVRFAAGRDALRIDAALLETRVAASSRYVFGVLTKRADALLAELDAGRTLRADVEKRILPILHTGETRVDTIAADLGMSRQTLFHRLKAEGASFAEISENLRRRLALDYLAAGRTSIAETAYLVGFSETAAFSRAFKRWTGSSPRAWMRRGPKDR